MYTAEHHQLFSSFKQLKCKQKVGTDYYILYHYFYLCKTENTKSSMYKYDEFAVSELSDDYAYLNPFNLKGILKGVNIYCAVPEYPITSPLPHSRDCNFLGWGIL